MSVRDSGLIVTLDDGPFAGVQRPLLVAEAIAAPPERLHAYRCPCCERVVVMTPADPREGVMDGEPVRYRRAGLLNYVHQT